MHRSLVRTAYVVTIFVAGLGVAPLFWNPLSNIYSRRPLYLASVLLYLVTLVGLGASKDFGTLLAFRFLNGFLGGMSSLGIASLRRILHA
jgi:MFS family permease